MARPYAAVAGFGHANRGCRGGDATARPDSCNPLPRGERRPMDDQSTPRATPRRQPTEDDGRLPDMHALRTPLTVVILRAQVLRRHLRRGDDSRALEAEMDLIDATLAQLSLAIDKLDPDGRHG